ncbi:MAG: glycosyltransferase [Xanthomonadales bacterium]|nr:glycosyltransferase [Xanthomonadales bacterium]
MRVLHIGKYYPPYAGGIEAFSADLVNALRRQGVACRVIAHASPADLDEETADVVRVPVLTEFLFTPLSPGFRRALRDGIRNFRPDLLHIHVPNPSALWLLTLPEARTIPWVLHWHSDIVASELQRKLRLTYPLYRPLETRLLRNSRAVIATSHDYLESSTALRPWRDKTHVIPLGLDPGRLTVEGGADTGDAWPAGKLRVLALGRLTYYKGFQVLIRAVAKVPDVCLLIAGDGHMRAELEAVIRTTGTGDRVRIVAGLDDAARDRLLATCDLLCQPSLERTEAFGIVLLEAMAFGKPVVASAIEGSGAPWVVRTARHGRLIAPGDSEVLSRTLAELRDSDQLRAELGARGQAALEAHFHIDRTAEAVRELYASLSPDAAAESR